MKRCFMRTVLFSAMLVFFSVERGLSQETYQPLKILAGGSYTVNSVAFSPDDALLASGNDDATVTLWDPVTGNKLNTLRGHSPQIYFGSETRRNSVNAVAFSPDGKVLASGGSDETILWNTATWEKFKNLKDSSVNAVAFSPDSKIFASGGTKITLWDTATWQVIKEFGGHSAAVTALTFGNDGKWLATGSADRTVMVWEAATGRKIYTLDGRSRVVQSIDISPDGTILASGGNFPNIVIWDLKNGFMSKLISTSQRSMVLSVKFSKDGKTLISSYNNGRIDFWDLETKNPKQRLSPGRKAVASLALSKDSRLLASGDSEGKILLWKMDTAK